MCVCVCVCARRHLGEALAEGQAEGLEPAQARDRGPLEPGQPDALGEVEKLPVGWGVGHVLYIPLSRSDASAARRSTAHHGLGIPQ